MKRELRLPVSHAGPSVEHALFDELTALLKQLRPNARSLPELHARARLDRDLGLDSLSRMELLARLERRFHVRIHEQSGFSARTVADLLDVLADAAAQDSTIDSASLSPALSLSRQEPLNAPATASTLIDVLEWHAQRHPERLHVHFEGGEADGTDLSYGTLLSSGQRIAAALQARGLQPSEAVALMLPTHPDFLTAFIGIMLAGGVPVPLYPPLRPGEMAEYWRRQAGILRNCGARMLLGNAALTAHRHVVRALTGVGELLSVSDLASDAAPEAVAIREDDLALLQYTSGSTADPKGVMISHANVLANLRAMGAVTGVSSADTFVSWLPLYHDMGLIGAWIGSLYFGLPLVLMPPHTFLLRPERWLWAVHRYRATLSAAPNFAYELCTHRIEDAAVQRLDLSSLRMAFCGAEPVFATTLQRFADRFARHGFRSESLYPVYGLAENTLGLAFPPPGRGVKELLVERDGFLRDGIVRPATRDEEALSFVSCGLTIPWHELRVADEGDRELPADRQGHVQFKGPSACSGYFRNPEGTRALLHGGWHDSGDLGFLHEGELYLSGRSKDLIIRAGRHLHPQSLEQAVGELPGVRRGRVAAFGAHASAAGTERLVVVAETRLKDADGRHELHSRIQEAIAVLAGEPADEIVLAAPGAVLKTPSGKLRRTACREAYEGGRLGSAGAPVLLAVLARGMSAGLRRRLRRLREWSYAAYVWGLCALSTPAFALAMLLPSLERRWNLTRRVLNLLRRASGMPMESTRLSPLPATPCIFVANHASYIDALVLICALPRPVAFVAKEELAHRWLLGWLLRRLGVVFVARFDPVRCTEVVSMAGRAKRDFLFFPEGTFGRMPGLLPFHLGAFSAAVEGALPVVPVAVRGTRHVLHDGEWRPRRGPLAVIAGAALVAESGKDGWAETLRLAAQARRFLLAQLDEPDLESRGSSA